MLDESDKLQVEMVQDLLATIECDIREYLDRERYDKNLTHLEQLIILLIQVKNAAENLTGHLTWDALDENILHEITCKVNYEYKYNILATEQGNFLLGNNGRNEVLPQNLESYIKRRKETLHEQMEKEIRANLLMRKIKTELEDK